MPGRKTPLVRVCVRCGAEFSADRQSAVCAECAYASRHAPTLIRRKCADCGKDVIGGPTVKYCASCRVLRQRAANARRRRDGAVRKLGSVDRCAECGREYVVKAGRQLFCADCAAAVTARKAAARKAERYYAGEIVRAPRKPHYRCVVCGSVIPPERLPKYTCSAGCETSWTRSRQRKADAKRRRRRD